MRVLFLSFFSILLSLTTQAQDITDGLRYSQNDLLGSARFTAMSGAFSSLGGDMSAIGLNPAGATTYSTNQYSGTLSFYNQQNNSDYFGNLQNKSYASINDNFLSFDQIGGIWVFKSNTNDWNKFAVAFNYNKEATYGNSLHIQGVNPLGSSTLDYFLSNANGMAKDDLDLHTGENIDNVYSYLGENMGYSAQQAFLAYQAYAINPVDDTDPNNTQYTGAGTYSQVAHNAKINNTGHKSRMDFSVAATYEHQLQLGFSLTTYNIDYTQNNRLIEDHYAPISDLQLLQFNNTLSVEGSGLGIKLGLIYKPTNNIRFGIALHSPEWLEINESTKQSIHTEFGNGDVVDIAPNINNSFAPYKVVTPTKIIAGGSLVIQKKGLISVDYTYQNYAGLHFKEKDTNADSTYFDNLNDQINNQMQGVHNLRVGGELKLDKLSLRAGTFMKNSPYKNQEDLNASNGFTAGFGYKFGKIIMDASYINAHSITKQFLSALPDPATINIDTNKFTLGLRYNF